MRTVRAVAILLFVLCGTATLANAQACPGGTWGNGQCIGACDSPLVNPNVDLKFYSWSCLGSSRIICTDGGAFCYPEYTAYDRVYGQYCGVITDYGDGECTFPYLGLNQQEPAPFYRHSAFKLAIDVKQPVVLKPLPIRQVTLHKSRFWWHHARV